MVLHPKYFIFPVNLSALWGEISSTKHSYTVLMSLVFLGVYDSATYMVKAEALVVRVEALQLLTWSV